MGLGFQPLQIGPPSTKVPSCKIVNVLNDEKEFEDTQPNTNSSPASEHDLNNITESDIDISTFN